MRLLNTTTIALEVFDNDPPPYAILSHRWEDEEVSFQDIEDGRAKEKRGYHKIQMACGIAATAGIEHIWVDTCCINKGDSAELSEAINSMYLWYEESTICYVYMSDLPSTWVPPDDIGEQTNEDCLGTQESITSAPDPWLGGQEPIPTYSRNDFQKSRWFERGWTLQELLAPSAVVFLNNDWEEVGTKLNLWEYITARTGIPGIILHGQDVQSASIAQRMSWAADRRTTRIEDRAYSLMGLFGVNMPLLYGERQNAFLRLQEEIIKTSNDHSIFAWGDFNNASGFSDGSLLAHSPTAFCWSWSVVCSESPPNMISLDSRGIHLTIPVGMPVLRAKSTDGQWWLTRAAWLPCTFYDSSNTGRRRSVVIVLTEVEGVYQRLTVRHSQDDSHPEQTPQSTICCYRTRRIRSGPPVLSRLASQGNLTAVGLQLEKGVGHPIRKRWCEEALIHAAVTGKDQAVKLLLDTGLEAEDRFLISQKALRYIMPFVSVPQNVVTVLVQVGLAQGNTYQAVRDILCQAPEEDSQCVVARHILLALDHQTRRAVCETFLSEHMTGRSHSDKRRHLYDSIINDPASSGCVT